MIRTLDLSNWTTPYDLYGTSWPLISGGWEILKERGMAGLSGGSLVGNVLGLGQEESAAPAEPVACDFTSGPLVVQLQQSLGVPETGVFDQETCNAYHEEMGEPPTAAALAALVTAPCGTVAVPVCEGEKRLGMGAIVGLSVFALAAASLMLAGGKGR